MEASQRIGKTKTTERVFSKPFIAPEVNGTVERKDV